MIIKGLRRIDDQEAHVDPRDVLQIRIQSRMLTELTNLDFMKMRYIFTFSGKKGMDRIGFTKFIWEISRFKPLDFQGEFELTEDQEVWSIYLLVFSYFLNLLAFSTPFPSFFSVVALDHCDLPFQPVWQGSGWKSASARHYWLSCCHGFGRYPR